MKSLFGYLFFFLLMLLGASFFACKKSNYLDDGGVHTAATPYSTYDYLAAQKYHDFDTVLLVIDHFNLKDSVNSAATFFSPTDFSMHRLMMSLQVSSMDSLYTLMTSKMITQFLFPEKITLDGSNTSVQTYSNWADTIAGVKKIASSYGAVTTSFTYYVLQYIKINGYPDGTSGAPANDPTDALLNCQTTGIETSTGTTLHVLSNASNLSLK